jgi:hypothetical protein
MTIKIDQPSLTDLEFESVIQNLKESVIQTASSPDAKPQDPPALKSAIIYLFPSTRT